MDQPAASYLDLIFFAVLAAGVLYKLYTVLGRSDFPPSEKPRDTVTPAEQNQEEHAPEGMVISPMTPAPQAKPLRKDPEPVIADDNLSKALGEIRAKDPNFSAGAFLSGAKTAFEMVLKALQEGDKTTLRNLLSAEVYKDFASEIENREKAGRFPQITLVALRKADIVEAALNKFKATIAITFESEQVHVVRDRDKKIIEGDPSAVVPVTDRWAFERDLRSSNPNWTIIET